MATLLTDPRPDRGDHRDRPSPMTNGIPAVPFTHPATQSTVDALLDDPALSARYQDAIYDLYRLFVDTTAREAEATGADTL